MNSIVYLKLVAFCLLALVGCVAHTEVRSSPTDFPGTLGELLSPTKQYAVVNRDASDAVEEKKLGDNHAIYLKDMKTGNELKILSYARSVSVTWSPDGNYLSISDYVGSNYSTVYFFDSTKRTLASCDKLFIKYLHGKHKDRDVHVYGEHIKWLNGRFSLVKLWGYGMDSPDGFEFYFLYDVVRKIIEPIELPRK